MTRYSEYNDSQSSALNLLQKLGWQYITPEQTIKERDGLFTGVLLEEILAKQLHKINNFKRPEKDQKTKK